MCAAEFSRLQHIATSREACTGLTEGRTKTLGGTLKHRWRGVFGATSGRDPLHIERAAGKEGERGLHGSPVGAVAALQVMV